jgi:hypothetical protein
MIMAFLMTISLIAGVFALVMINGVPIVHAQSLFPVPPPPTSQIIQQPGTTGFFPSQTTTFPPSPSLAQPCTNDASNVQGSHDKKATQIQNLENRCTVNIILPPTTTPTCPPGFILSGNVCTPSTTSKPIANAGPSQAVSQGSSVTLVGTGSFAQNGATIVSYSWTQTSGTPVSLNGANTATPTFTAPTVTAPTSLTFSLTVTDSNGAVSSPATVTISVS